MNKRRSGYYWVKFKGYRWEIAQFFKQQNLFKIIGAQTWWHEHEFHKIDETPITR